jgi:hypothetical protein
MNNSNLVKKNKELEHKKKECLKFIDESTFQFMTERDINMYLAGVEAMKEKLRECLTLSIDLLEDDFLNYDAVIENNKALLKELNNA